MHKKLVVITLLSAFNLMAKAQKIDSSFAGGYYVKRVAYFESLPYKKNSIVFLGNSITEVGQWSEFFLSKNVVNRGISGDVSYGVLNRLPYILSQHPQKIFLTIGVNDIKRGLPLDELAKVHERIIKLIRTKSPKTQLFVQSILPVNEKMLAEIYVKITNQKINKANAVLKELSSKYNCVFVDLHQSPLKNTEGELKKEYSTDGLHLQPEAYLVWANYLKSLNHIK